MAQTGDMHERSLMHKVEAVALYRAIALVLNDFNMAKPQQERPNEVLAVGIRISDESLNADIAIPSRKKTSEKIAALLSLCESYLPKPEKKKAEQSL